MEVLLLLLILVPLIGAALCFVVPEKSARYVALATSVVELLLVLPLYRTAFGNQFVEYEPHGLVITGINAGLRLGCDATSWWLVFLTAALMPLATLASFGGIHVREKGYYFWLTALMAAMMGTFLARDGLLFYVFFELTLIPMFFLIGLWGGDDREFAAKKFFLYTFVGSLFTLAAVLYLGFKGNSFDFADLIQEGQSITNPTTKLVVFLGLLAGFAVKVPLFPVHTWLPLAHTVAPTAGSVILAGVLLKLGTYGVLKLAIPMGLLSDPTLPGVNADGLLPVMEQTVIPIIATLCIIGIIYGALVAWVQADFKKLVAYSSVSHLGFCVLGLISLNTIGVQGGVFYMINHGISTGALFLLIGMIYDRFHTRMFKDYSGLGRVMPVFSFFLVLFTMSSIGLPGTNGFVSEFLTILGAFTSPWLGPWYGIFAAIGVILGAVYMLYMVARLIFGPLKLPEVHGHAHQGAFGNPPVGTQEDTGQAVDPHANHPAHPHTGHAKGMDLTGREIGILTPLAIAVIVLGVMPTQLVLDPIRQDVEQARRPLVLQLDEETRTARYADTGEALPLGGATSVALTNMQGN